MPIDAEAAAAAATVASSATAATVAVASDGGAFSSSPAAVWGKKPAPHAQCSRLLQQLMKGGLAGGRVQIANGGRCGGRSAAAEGNTTCPETAEPW